MPTQYLLPCQCGKKTEVDSSQSGLSVRCACGAELAVPPMRGLAALERVEAAAREVPSEAGPSWSAQQGLLFLGSAIVVVAGLAAFGVWWFRMPEALALQPNYKEAHRAFIDQQPPETLLQFWDDFRRGINKPQIDGMLDRYDAAVAEVLGWEMVIGAVAAVGLLLAVVGLFLRGGRPASSRVPAGAAR